MRLDRLAYMSGPIGDVLPDGLASHDMCNGNNGDVCSVLAWCTRTYYTYGVVLHMIKAGIWELMK
jgi:hypothetical protein